MSVQPLFVCSQMFGLYKKFACFSEIRLSSSSKSSSLFPFFHKTVALPVRHTEVFLLNSSDIICCKQKHIKQICKGAYVYMYIYNTPRYVRVTSSHVKRQQIKKHKQLKLTSDESSWCTPFSLKLWGTVSGLFAGELMIQFGFSSTPEASPI